jgi:hypothetical protein
MSRRLFPVAFLAWVGLVLALPCLADPPASKPAEKSPAAISAPDQKAQASDSPNEPSDARPAASKFLRLTRDDDGELVSMDTAIVRYVPQGEGRQGLVVDLIGVVHIGEKEYFEQLNKQFQQYDALLYELVAPEKHNAPPKGAPSSGHPIAAMQNGMKDLLGLEFQLSHIDYRQKNFVHADMSPDAFSKSMSDRGESLWTIFLRSMGQGIAQESKNRGGASGLPMLMALFSKDRSLLMKQTFAQQFEDLESSMNAINGPDGSTIITERNKVALGVLAKQIAAGKKKIGIFYGAGHMPDMEQRLLDEFGLRVQEQQWLVAWQLASKRAGSEPSSSDDSKPAAEKP